MPILPPLPPAEGLHPLVVHFPIALLLTVPVFVIIGLVWRAPARAMHVSAVLLLLLGTAGACIATSTGETAAESAERAAPAAAQVLERHEELGELSRNLFLGVTALGIGLVAAAWRRYDRITTPTRWIAGVVFLAVHAGASLLLANAAHEGGRLVHEFGVHAPTSGSPSTSPPLETGGRSHTDDE